jgi:hypothetical protein
MILIERLQRAGASETEIIRAVAESDGGYDRSREPFWRRLRDTFFATPG